MKKKRLLLKRHSVTDQAAPSSKLYTPRLLALSAELADFPLTGSFTHTAEERSRTCGSVIELGLSVDASGGVTRLGMQVTACAVGQSSAAVMAKAASGKSAQDFTTMLEAIKAWLSGEQELPDWPGFVALEPALPHAGRHGALLLPWKAMHSALSSPQS